MCIRDSQKPASLTWLKKTDPAPMASTSRAGAFPPIVAATGAMTPAAVMVATVADPVARRMKTATSQASSSGEKLEPLIQSASMVPIPVSTSTCLKPPPAPTMSRIPAIGPSESPIEEPSAVPLIPDPRPSVNIPTRTVMSRASRGAPRKSSVTRIGCSLALSLIPI